MQEISIKEIQGFAIGQTENREGGTGVTVVLSKKGVLGGLDVRGGGPASRESTLVDPLTAPKAINGVVLAGGSAYGLDAAGGVMRYLEERGYGYDVGFTTVPLVCQADVFDLNAGDMRCRPDADMAYAACIASENGGNAGRNASSKYNNGYLAPGQAASSHLPLGTVVYVKTQASGEASYANGKYFLITDRGAGKINDDYNLDIFHDVAKPSDNSHPPYGSSSTAKIYKVAENVSWATFKAKYGW